MRIPERIMKKPVLLKRCLRGIADTDFTLIFTRDHKYPRICAQFASEMLVRDIEKDLRTLGFTLNVSYNGKRKNNKGNEWITNMINLDGPHNLKRWMKEIEFSNLRIISRYKVWKKYGYLKPKSTLPERLELLNGQEVMPYE